MLSYELIMSLSIPNRLGLFFLETTLYPGEKKFLHVFERSYRKLVDNCLASHGLFVIIWEEDNKVKEIGSIARVKRVLARYEGGELDIEVEGIRRVKVYMIDETAFYRQGYLDPYNDTVEAEASSEGERLIAQHIKLLEIIGANINPQYYQSSHPLSWLIGRNCGLSLPQRQNLLEMQSETDRVMFLIDYLSEFIPKVERNARKQMHIMSNGHAKDFLNGNH